MKHHIIPFAAATAVLVISMSAWVMLTSSFSLPTFSFDIHLPSFGSSTSTAVTSTDDTKEVTKPAVTTKPTSTPSPSTSPTKPIVVKPVVTPASTVPTTPTAASFVARGNAAMTNKTFADAITAYAAAAKLSPKDGSILLRLAGAQTAAGATDDALDTLDTAAELGADAPHIALLRGRVYLARAKMTDADKAFATAGNDARFERGLLASFFDRRDEARRDLLDAAKDTSTPTAVAANTIIAAYDEFALFPDGEKSHLDTLLARAYAKAGYYELAVQKIEPVLKDEAQFRDAWLIFGYAKLALKKYDDAVDAFDTAYRIDPAKPETAYFLGIAHDARQEYADAAKYFELAIGNNYTPQSDALRHLADAYERAGAIDKAMPIYAQLTTTATDASAYIRPIYLTIDHVKDGKKAWQLAADALRRFPDSAMSYNLAGWVSVANGYLPEARTYLTRAVELDPTLAAAQLNFGWYYEKAGDTDAAKAAYKKAFEMDTTGSIGREAATRYNRLTKG